MQRSRVFACSVWRRSGATNIRTFCSSDQTKRPQPSDDEKLPVSFEDVSRAYFRLQGAIKRTHCDYSDNLSELCEATVYLKKDFMQFTGSFKERGARNALLSLSPDVREKGVICASAGNHALALTWHAKLLGIPVTCVMPKNAPFTKVNRCRKFGGNVILYGSHIGEAKEYALREHPDMRYINGYDDPEIIAGAGTMAIEILEQVPDVEVIPIPVGGAGLLAGMSLAVKTLRPDVEIVGVEPSNVPSFHAALEAGHPVNAYKDSTLADGLGVPVVGANAFKIARRFTDSTALVTERDIALAMLMLIETNKIVVEGGGAAALAAILPGGPLFGKFRGKKIVIPLCGGNIDTTVLGRVIDRGLAADQRLVRFSATVSDRPGGIAKITREIADIGVSIKDIYHERAWLDTAVDMVTIKCVVETTGKEHTAKLFSHLEGLGYPVRRND